MKIIHFMDLIFLKNIFSIWKDPLWWNNIVFWDAPWHIAPHSGPRKSEKKIIWIRKVEWIKEVESKYKKHPKFAEQIVPMEKWNVSSSEGATD